MTPGGELSPGWEGKGKLLHSYQNLCNNLTVLCSTYPVQAFKIPIRQFVHPNPFLMKKKGILASHEVLVIPLLKYLIILGRIC